MSSKNIPGLGTSRYRQVKVTFTLETNGRLSVAVYGKGLNQEWQERSCLARYSVIWEAPINSTEDALLALIHCVEKNLLPGIG